MTFGTKIEISKKDSMVKLVYVTPEMIILSQKFQACIREIYEGGKLAR